MKNLITAFMTLISFNTLASINSIEISGTFENDSGCRAYAVNCSNFIAEDEENYNSCSMELFIDGESRGSLRKGGKIVETSEGKIFAEDVGFRSSIIAIPSYKNVKVKFDIIETTEDPMTYPEKTVLSFDLKMKKSLLNIEVANCKNMVLVEDEF